MTRGTGTRATRKPVVVVAGEDSTDRRSLRILLEAMCPDMRGRIVEINDSVRLKLATGQNLSNRVAALEKKARARARRENATLACVFVHEDLDGPDGTAYRDTRDRVQKALEAEFGTAHYVLVVAEIEAWLLLFPDSLAVFAPSWRVPPKRRGKDTGMFTDPKKIMIKEVAGSVRRYRESDAPEVLEEACKLGDLDAPTGSNRSWRHFCDEVRKCCLGHVGGRGENG